MAMFNALRTYKGHTVARIDGMAASMASMATIVALGAKRVAMADNGWWMVHNHGGSWQVKPEICAARLT